MENTLKKVKITRLFDKKNIDWSLKPNVNVLVGKNGAGKSIILQLIKTAIEKEVDDLGHRNALDLCERVEIEFTDGKINEAFKSNSILDIEDFRNFVTSESFVKNITTSLPKEMPEEIKNDFANRLKRDLSEDKDIITSRISSYSFNRGGHKLPIEFISTVNVNANAINRKIRGDGSSESMLDSEIREEIIKLQKSSNKKELEEKLTKALNLFFKDTHKDFFFNNDKLPYLKIKNQQISYKDLSAGEQQLIYIFLKVTNATENSALILMDEPEISLHLSWQEKLINEIRKVNPTSQLIIVTHSPAIVMNGWIDCLVDFKDIVSDSHGEPARLSDRS